MNFVTIDFETATSDKTSACQIGISTVINGQEPIVYSSFIKPPQWPNFNYINVGKNKITADLVKDAPTFDMIWKDVYPLLNNKIVFAYQTATDIDHLVELIKYYRLETPSFEFFDSLAIARFLYPDLISYKLESICNKFDIYYESHKADKDSKALADLMIKFSENNSISDFKDLCVKHGYTNGILNKSKYIKFLRKKYNKTEYNKRPEIEDSTEDDINEIVLNSNHPLFKKKIVFTGNFMTDSKENYQRKSKIFGYEVLKNTTQQTNYLVHGIQDETIVKNQEGLSSKHVKALEYIKKGIDIKILNEDEFLILLGQPEEPIIQHEPYFEFKKDIINLLFQVEEMNEIPQFLINNALVENFIPVNKYRSKWSIIRNWCVVAAKIYEDFYDKDLAQRIIKINPSSISGIKDAVYHHEFKEFNIYLQKTRNETDPENHDLIGNLSLLLTAFQKKINESIPTL